MTRTPWYFTEPENCPQCSARRQYNLDYEVVHARAGSIECPPQPLREDPVILLLQELRSAA